ncbi:aspartate aminotransferase [Methylocaldum marinum]|uniref:Aminotransferase n=1 Tax=Methylocaldum marinum TaxID=1432792 RepID=A0A250KRH6_9GAMM|nr:pyridoxal phosphate-dependent aminotransferase [Methylocaldum marinum]BBA34197.1 aspartate aminotransferase [Methylocaldum marinum]
MPEPKVSRRMAAVQAPIIPVIAELIRNHPGTISLGQGVVFYGPPPAAAEEIRDFFAKPENHKYGPVQGLPRLLELIEEKLAAENGIDCAGGRRIVVTAGGNMGFLNALFAIADPEDEVILPLPYYFNQEMAIRMLNCTPVLVPTDENYQLRPDLIKSAINERTRAIVTISPNNPSGAVYSEEALRTVNTICREHGIYHISDEAYEYFTYGAKHFSPAAVENSAPHTISLFSLSKAYGFAGWRIGYMVIPDHLYEAVLKAQDTNLICAPSISQHAAVGALSTGSAYCRERLETIARVRGIVLDELRSVADICRVPEASGAFYLLLKLATDLDSMTVAQRLIREHKVAVIPGTAFGLEKGCYLRVAYGALEPGTAAAGTRRLVQGLHEITGA